MFRFTIRDVLWLMVVVGMGIALVMENSLSRTQKAKLAHQRDLLKWQLESTEELLSDRGVKLTLEDSGVSIEGNFSG